MSAADESSRGRWGLAFACWCAALSAFQAALAGGAPWGAAAWGGGHRGTLPGRLRLASAVAAPLPAAVGAVAAGRLLGPRGRRRVLLGAASYTGLGVLVNGLSPSIAERTVWVPMCALGTLLAVQARREAAVPTPASSRQGQRGEAGSRPAGRRVDGRERLGTP